MSHQEKVSVIKMIKKLSERLEKSREISNKQQETTDLLLKKTAERLKEARKC